MLRFSITTLGCKVNQYDSAALSATLLKAGLRPYRPSGRAEGPDLLVVNTCCVTATARSKSRRAIRRAVGRFPTAAVLVTGCYCDYDPGALADLLTAAGLGKERAFVVGHHGDWRTCAERAASSLRKTAEKQTAGESRPTNAVVGFGQGPAPGPGGHGRGRAATPKTIKARRAEAIKRKVPGASGLESISCFDGHQRAFVKVQDGCDAFCSYCVVPYTRCVLRSRRIGQVLDECRRLVASGHKEIVLCGVFLGAYGRATAIRRRWDGQPSKLPELIAAIAEIDGLWRVRLSSLEPGDLTENLLELCKRLDRFAPHFHLPLQSGSDRILRRMNRQYTAEQFAQAVDRLRETLDRPAVTTDIIVGFPGETEDDFAQTLAMARRAGFAKIHAFPFSPIEGTAAWRFRHEAPPPAVVKRRLAELANLERQLAADYRRRFIGESIQGLVESRRRDGPAVAMTDRYLTAAFNPADGTTRPGQVVDLRVTAVTPQGLSAEPA